MNEKLLQFIWQYALFNVANLKLANGKPLTIIQRGQINTNAGPDFLNAKIKIDDAVWVGNVELHIHSSDWFKHGHQNDAAYQNIILHVVYKMDKAWEDTSIPILELHPYIESNTIEKYANLMDTRPKIACEQSVKNVPLLIWNTWLTRMLTEKWENKFTQWNQKLTNLNHDWVQLFYCVFARNLGGKVNADAFEMLANITPLHILAKHRNNVAHIEAILFGQAGLIPTNPIDPYEIELKVHYAFYKQKYKLEPMEVRHWKFLRMRPAGFPTVRIAQLAMLLHQSDHLFDKLLRVSKMESLTALFQVGASAYWDNHYTFGTISKKASKQLGAKMQQSIWINTIAPLQYLYGKHHGEKEMMQKALELLHQCPTEENSIIKLWHEVGVKAKDAAQSQGLIYLYNAFCEARNCLQCSVGLNIIRS